MDYFVIYINKATPKRQYYKLYRVTFLSLKKLASNNSNAHLRDATSLIFSGHLPFFLLSWSNNTRLIYKRMW